MLDTATVARHFAVSEGTIRTWIRDGRLRGQRFNRLWRCAWPDVWAIEKGPLPRGILQDRYKSPLVTKRQIATALGVSTRSIERLEHRGLPTRKVFEAFRCNPADVEDWLKLELGIHLPPRWEAV